MRKFLSKGLIKGFISLLGICVSLLLIFQVPPLKKKAFEWAIHSALNEPSHKIEIESISGFFPFSLQASKCILSDKNGPWMELKGIDASLKIFPFQGYISLESANLYHLPILETSSKANITFSDAFFTVVGQSFIRSFVLKQVKIDPAIFGRAYEGNFLLVPDDQGGQKINITSSVEGKVLTEFSALVGVKGKGASIRIYGRESAQGIFAKLLEEHTSISAGTISIDGNLTFESFTLDGDAQANLAINHEKWGKAELAAQQKEKIAHVKLNANPIGQKLIKAEATLNRRVCKENTFPIEQLEFLQEENILIKGNGLIETSFPIIKAETYLSVSGALEKDVNDFVSFVNILVYDLEKKKLTLKGGTDHLFFTEFLGKKFEWSVSADVQNINNLVIESLMLSSDKGYSLQGEARLSKDQVHGSFKTIFSEQLSFESLLSGSLTKPLLKTHAQTPQAVPFHLKEMEISANFEHSDFWAIHLQALGHETNIDLDINHYPNSKKTGVKIKADTNNLEPWFKGVVPVHFEANLDENLTGMVTGSVKDAKLGSLAFMRSDFSMIVNQGRGEFDLKSIQRISRKKKTSVPILKSRGEIDFNRLTLLIKEMKLTPDTNTIVLDQACLIDFKNAKIDQLNFSIDGGKIKVEKFKCASCVDASSPSSWGGKFSVINVPLSILQIFESSLALNGTINGNAQLTGEQAFPEVKGQLKISNVNYAPLAEKQISSLERMDGNINFDWLPNSLSWKIEGHAEPTLTFISNGKIALFSGWIEPSSQVQLEFKGSLHIGIFSAFLGGGDRINGVLTTDLIVNGNIDQPTLKGAVRLTGGLYEIADFGTMIHNITLDAEAKGSRIVISNLTATDGNVGKNVGQLNGQGQVELKKLFSPLVDIRLDLTNFQVAQSDSFSGTATGSLFLKGESIWSKVTGEVLLKPAALFLEEASSPDIPTIKIVNQQASSSTEMDKTKSKENGSKLFPIELKLNAPQDFKIEGFGLESSWGGVMMVMGTVGDPYLVGTIRSLSGKLDVFGKTMKITEGSITYKETPQDDPYLLIKCVRDVDAGTTVTLVIDGYASDPRFTFSSTPALPEEEILSRLLFGKELGKISVGQSLQLATAAAAMNGKKGLNVMDKIRSSFGLDTLELKEQKKADSYDTTGSQALSIGKEFGNVKVSIDQGVSTGTSKATLEAAIAPNLNVDVDIGGGQSSGIGLNWVKRY